MADLVDGLVAGLPDQRARAALVARAEGIPLFAVETVRGLIDRDLVVPLEGRYVLAPMRPTWTSTTLGAPASLQALVAAGSTRSTRASAGWSRRQRARARRSPRAPRSSAPDVDDLDDVLRSLVRKQILELETDRFSAERGQYRFVQAVVRQVAYDTLSRRDRKARHLAVAGTSRASPTRPATSHAVVAQHYLDALASSSPGDHDRDELAKRAIESSRRPPGAPPRWLRPARRCATCSRRWT